MKALLNIALFGTGKHPKLPIDPANELDALLTANQEQDTAEQLLLWAGSHAIYEQAGWLPASGVSSPPPGPPSTKALRSVRLTQLLQQVMKSDQRELLREFLHTMQQEHIELPYEVLPLAMETTDREIRQLLQPLLGERGRWLSMFNPRWHWVNEGVVAITSDDRVALRRAWEEGKLAQRSLALTVMRQTDAAEGRRWLEETIPQEKADARAQFLECLHHGLSLDDEPLLEKLLLDRSEGVRQLAAELLQQLPASRLSERMKQRAEGMLQFRKTVLGAKVSCTPPEELPLDWQADGIPARVQAGKGKKAIWVEKLFSVVPVTHWSKHFQTTPEKLLAAVAGDEFAQELVQGWTRALQVYPDTTAEMLQWTHALWGHWLSRWQHDKKKSQETLNCMVAVLKLLPPQTAEQNVLPFLVPGRLHSDALLLMVDVLPRPWSPWFASNYLQLARKEVKHGMIDTAFEWAKTLEIACKAIPRTAFAAALQHWDTARTGAQSWTAKALDQLIDRFVEVVALRQMFFEELRR